MKKKKLRNDLLLAVGLLGVALVALLIFRFGKTEGQSVSVLIDGKETARYSLNEVLEQELVTDNGTNLLVIRDGKAYIGEADCPDGICAGHAPISRVGETIVCLPHKLVIRVTESKTVALDAVA